MTRKDRLLSVLDGDIDAVLVTSELNQYYLTKFNYTDGYVLVTRNKSYVITDFRYIEAANAAVGDEFEVVMPEGDMRLEIKALLAENGVKKLSFEDKTLSCADYISFSELFEGIEMVRGGSDIIENLREHKTADELEIIARAQSITDAAFEHILKFIKPDMTELEVALELEFFMRGKGAQSVAFDTIAVSGASSSLPHGVPAARKLEKGFFTMDFGARLDGYCSDMTRTVVLGKADDDMKRLYNTVLKAQLAGIEMIKLGESCQAVDRAARDIIEDAGYHGCFGHGLGHGVGMFIHEAPRLSPKVAPTKKLEVGHVVTCEPGIYIAEKYGCRIEDMLAVTENGTINFTKSPKELIELF
ncbi:MAG: aminopeptidase P family protein [Ruminococcaceae bacterium]|nr:aminopeptidase P family protein [Oscillospiraceae bacterium]